MTGIAWLVLTNPAMFGDLSKNNKEEEDSQDNEIPLKNVFYEFNHESTKAWLKWIDGQDESKKQFAYDMLVNYLDLPLKKLGAITSDVVKAIVVFKKKEGAFDVLIKLLKKSKDHFSQYKSIDMFYEAAAIGLTKIDHEKAEAFLINELQDTNGATNLIPIQKYLVSALCHLEFNPNLEKCWVRILSNPDYPEATKKELLNSLESKADKIRERVYKKILNEQIDSKISSLSDNDKFIIEEVFYKLRNLITKEDYDEEVWTAMIRAVDSTRIGNITNKLLIEMITSDERGLSQNQVLELLDKPNRSMFLEACSKRHKLLETEASILKAPIKAEDLAFDKTKFNIEKSKKTKSVAHQLLDHYHNLEKIMQTSVGGRVDKSSTSVSVITGTGESEKLHLLRAYAANKNKSFIYIDIKQLLSSEGMAKEFKNHIVNNKPCLVYLDKIDKVLGIDLEKQEANIFKSITRSIKELSVLPSISITANIPYSQEDLSTGKLTLLSKIINGAGSIFRTIMTIDKPDDNTRGEIIHSYLEKINPKRITNSENFSIDELLEYSSSMNTLEVTLFLHQYFEISLLANGKLVSIEDFENRWQPSLVIIEEEAVEAVLNPEPEIGNETEDSNTENTTEEALELGPEVTEQHSAKL